MINNEYTKISWEKAGEDISEKLFLSIISKYCPEDAPVLHSSGERGEWSFAVLDKNKNQIHSNFISAKKALDLLSSEYTAKDIPKKFPMPFCGGYILALSYDYGVGLEKIDQPKEIHFPYLILRRTDHFFAYHKNTKTLYEVGEESLIGHKEFKTDYSKLNTQYLKPSQYLPLTPNLTKQEYLKDFENCQKEIEKGNSFQINYSQEFFAQSLLSPWDIFIHATKKNPAPFMVYWKFKKIMLLSPALPNGFFL